MSRSDSSVQSGQKKAIRWVVTIFLVTIVISAVISLISEEIMGRSGTLVAFVILFLIVIIGIVFDIIGVAMTSADEKPFHSMAARKVPGARDAIALLRQAEKVSSICCDVIGDVCGVVSGSASATIAARVIGSFDFTWPKIITLAMSALVAGITVGGKAIGKSFAVNSSTTIVHLVGRVIYGMKQVQEMFRKKNKK